MRLIRFAAPLLLVLVVTAGTARADVTLEAAVSAVTIPHTFDARLHDIAHQRAVEIVTDFSHAGMRPGTAEVLAWNSGMPDPLGWVVTAWLNSPPHLAVLTSPQYDLMGCATHTVGGAFYAACVLSVSGWNPTVSAAPSTEGVPETGVGNDVTPRPAPTPPVLMLPDAAMAP